MDYPRLRPVLDRLLAVPVLWLVTLACIAWSVTKRRAGRSMPLALLLLVTADPLGRPIEAAWDLTGVTRWSMAHHREVATVAGHDAILTGWGDWGATNVAELVARASPHHQTEPAEAMRGPFGTEHCYRRSVDRS